MSVSDLPSYFSARISEREDGCWEWTGPISHEGYGRASVGGVREPAHRSVYRILVGDPGQHLHHACRNRECVNPGHLEPLDPGEHTAFHQAEIAFCPRGHEYDEENTYVAVVRGYPCRNCKACHRERERARYWSRKAAA